MLIRDFKENGSSDRNMSENEENMKELGFINYNRTILLFVNPAEYKSGTFTRGRIIIINTSSYLSDSNANVIYPTLKDTLLNKVSLYFGLISLENPGDMKSAVVFISESQTKTNANLMNSDKGDDLIAFDNCALPISKNEINYTEFSYGCDFLLDYMCISENDLPPCSFYTCGHMFMVTGDYYHMCLDELDCSVFNQLLDEHTKVVFKDINLYDSFKSDVNSKAYAALENYYNFLYDNEKMDERQGGVDVDSILSLSFDNYIGTNATFIYEDGKVNVKGGYIPLGKQYKTHQLVKNVENTLETFRLNCKAIEDIYGKVRVLSHHSLSGDKNFIRYKDWNVAPFKGTSNYYNEENGKESNSSLSSLDNGEQIKKVVSDYISQNILESDNSYEILLKSRDSYTD